MAVMVSPREGGVGMLDLSRDEKAKHFLPRWLRNCAKRHNGIAPNVTTESRQMSQRNCAKRHNGVCIQKEDMI